MTEICVTGMNGMSKSKSLFWLLFITLLIISSSIYHFIWNLFFNAGTNLSNLAFIFLFVIAVIPISAYFAEKLTKLSLRKGLSKNRNFKIFISFILITTVSVISFSIYNDYREKTLNEVIHFNPNNWEYIMVNDTLKLDKEEHAALFNELFNRYHVKKMSDRDWDSDVSKEHGFSITIFTDKDEIIMASIYENRMVYYNDGKYYTILDGPIDFAWLDGLYSKSVQYTK